MPCNHNCRQGRNCTCELATRPAGQRWFALHFDCDGTPLLWEGFAASQAEAETTARADFAAEWAFYTPATRLVQVVEGANL